MTDTCWCGGTVVDNVSCRDSRFHQPFATGRRDKIEVLYLAGPMSGYPDSNYPAFDATERRLVDAGYTVVNPAQVVTGTEAHYVDFIREDLRLLLDCHGVAVLENWWESTGARNEVQVAGLLKMPVRTAVEWLDLR